jgi:rhodanese-related sulfurtransferase
VRSGSKAVDAWGNLFHRARLVAKPPPRMTPPAAPGRLAEGSMVRKTAVQMWAEASEKTELVAPPDLADALASGETLLLDVRLPQEIERRGTIEGSVPVPRQVIEWWADPDSPYFRADGPFGDFDARIVTFCDGGGNGAFTAVTLGELGYRNVATLEGGFYGWVAAGLPIVNAPA